MRLMMANRAAPSTYYVSLGDSMSIDAYAAGRAVARQAFSFTTETMISRSGRDATCAPVCRTVV